MWGRISARTICRLAVRVPILSSNWLIDYTEQISVPGSETFPNATCRHVTEGLALANKRLAAPLKEKAQSTYMRKVKSSYTKESEFELVVQW